LRSEWGRVPGPVEVTRFLEGPQPRRSELRLALGVFTEFIRGDPRDADRIIVTDSASEAVTAVRDIAIPT